MHEWLSGGVSPCQGEGRGFESRLVLSMIQKRDIRWMALFLYVQALPGSNGSNVYAPLVAGERPPDVLRRLVLFFIRISSVDVLFLWLYVNSWGGIS